MSSKTPTAPNVSATETGSSQSPTTFVAPISGVPPQLAMPRWLALINLGTLLTVLFTIVGFAYFLGGLSNTVTATNQRVEKLDVTVNGTSHDSVASRLSAIETKLERLDAIEAKIDKLEAKFDLRIDKLETKLDAKLDAINQKLSRR
jgi:hypothetical protein